MPTTQRNLSPPDAENRDALQNLFEVAFESLHSGLVLFDRRLNLILRNQTAKMLLPDEPDISRLLSNIALESSYEDWGTELRRVMETGLPRRLDVTVHPGGDQPDLYLDIVITPLRNPATGDTIGGLLLAEDVTSRAGMERRLAVSERLAAVGKLAARVAHELNNPLDGILRYTNMALRLAEKLDNAPQPDPAAPVGRLIGYLKNAKTGIVRMTEIISALLEFSRNTPSTFEQATINKIVEDAVAAMEGRAHESNVTVVCNFLQTDMPVVRGSNVFQVFCNLIKNAIEAMPKGGTLTVTTRLTDADVIVTFEDTGVGLPEQAEKIFEPFFTTKAPGKGTGLGLAVCKELIEKYSGTITAANRQPRGAVFTVSIPTSKLAAVPVEQWARKRRTGDAGKPVAVGEHSSPEQKKLSAES
ncbi:MAG TPA: ATP-binding protein [Phycisphaerae bacterium]|nr:ATP-binding protein [Phycisphaerae bacterium]